MALDSADIDSLKITVKRPAGSERGLREEALNKKVLQLTVLAAVAAATPALAHHSFGMFDREKVFVWEGTVKKFEWMNPHSHIIIVVPPGAKDPRTVGTWDIEGAAPNIMARQGWNKMTYKEGDKITVVGQPMRDGTKGGSLYYALKDGKRFYHDVNRNGGPGAGGRGIPEGTVLP